MLVAVPLTYSGIFALNELHRFPARWRERLVAKHIDIGAIYDFAKQGIVKVECAGEGRPIVFSLTRQGRDCTELLFDGEMAVFPPSFFS